MAGTHWYAADGGLDVWCTSPRGLTNPCMKTPWWTTTIIRFGVLHPTVSSIRNQLAAGTDEFDIRRLRCRCVHAGVWAGQKRNPVVTPHSCVMLLELCQLQPVDGGQLVSRSCMTGSDCSSLCIECARSVAPPTLFSRCNCLSRSVLWQAASKGAESSSTSNNNNNNNGSSSTVAARAAPKPKPAPRNDAVPVAEPRGQRASAADSGVGADSSTPPSSPSGGRSQDRRAAVAALFRGANIGDEALVQKFTDKLMARDRKEVDSFLANPQKLLMYFSKIMGGSASTSKLPVRKPGACVLEYALSCPCCQFFRCAQPGPWVCCDSRY